ncbi:MAG: YfhO family protein, partial [Planctomycetaceae bacterium]|nr:YfhO family protein [Planctomycetaceae bacterium]
IIPEQYWQGWRAFLEDGKEVPIRRVEEVFRGVDLPAGKHRLTMIYDPPLFKFGAILSLSGFIIILFMFVFGMVVQGRSLSHCRLRRTLASCL